MPFIAIQCPSCASTDVTLRGGGNYQCNHCSTAFLRKDQPAPRPAPAPPPPRAPRMPVNSYGPPPQQATVAPTPVQHVKPGRFRWGLWLFIMLVSFGGPLVAAVASFVQTSDATQAAAAVLDPRPTPTPPKTPTAVLPRRPSVNMGSGDADADANADADATIEDASDTQAKPKGEGTSLDQFQRLQGCSCRAKAGRADLYTRHDGGGTSITSAGMTKSMMLSFALKVGNTTPFTLPLTKSTAPSSEYEQGRFPLGVGCEGDTVVIATERKLTGWSIDDRSERWTVDLPGSFGEVRASDEPGIDCKSISIRGGVASVRVGGKRVEASLDTGEAPRNDASKRSARRAAEEPKPKPDQAKPKPDQAKPGETKPAPPKPDPPKPDKADAKAGKKKKKKKKGKRRKKKGKKRK